MIVIAGIAAVAVVGGLFLPWWEATLAGLPGGGDAVRTAGLDLDITGWELLGWADVLLVVLAVVGVASLLRRTPGGAMLAGVTAAAVVAARLLDPPGGGEAVDLRAGGVVALAGALGLAATGFAASRRRDALASGQPGEAVPGH